MRGWTSAVYGFYHVPIIRYVNERKCHVFKCLKCSVEVKRYQDTSDKNSSKALKNHAESCSGTEAVQAAMASGETPDAVRKKIRQANERNGTIPAMFDGLRKIGVAAYSAIQHTPNQTR
jgi:hypothetical protein